MGLHPPLRTSRRAAAAVEFALIAPLLCSLLLGMFEISRAIIVADALSNAAQMGARAAARQGTSNSDVSQDVSDMMDQASISGWSVTVQVNDVTADVSTATR